MLLFRMGNSQRSNRRPSRFFSGGNFSASRVFPPRAYRRTGPVPASTPMDSTASNDLIAETVGDLRATACALECVAHVLVVTAIEDPRALRDHGATRRALRASAAQTERISFTYAIERFGYQAAFAVKDAVTVARKEGHEDVQQAFADAAAAPPVVQRKP